MQTVSSNGITSEIGSYAKLRVQSVMFYSLIKTNTRPTRIIAGYIVAIMNSIIETISMKKAEITEAYLRKSLEKHMEKYLKENGGNTKEGDSVNALVDKVFSIWKRSGELNEHIKELNIRKNKYLATNNYVDFLKNEYSMDKNSRFLNYFD